MHGGRYRRGRREQHTAAALRPRLSARPDWDGDRGSSSVEFAILFPIIVILLFGGTQTAAWYFGRQVVQAAAEAGARAASLDGAPTGSGVAAADAYLDHVGQGTLTGYQADETDSAATVTVHIHATVINVIPLPGLNPSIDISITRPKETFTTGGGP